MKNSIRDNYLKLGVDKYYEENKDEYYNPHSEDIIKLLIKIFPKNIKTVLDLFCGDGLVTKTLLKNFRNLNLEIEGADKFFEERYNRETRKYCHNVDFNALSKGIGSITSKTYDLIIISYAIDLIPKSMINNVLYVLSRMTNQLLIIRPNNHEIISPYWKLTKKIKIGKSVSSLYLSV